MKPQLGSMVLLVVILPPLHVGCGSIQYFPGIQQFTECTNNPAISPGSPGDFDGGSVRDNVVWLGRGKLWTLYTAAQSGNPPYLPTIGIASSSDGCTWTKGGQVIVPNSSVRICSGGVFSPAVLYDEKSDVLTIAVSCVDDPSSWYSGPAAIAELQTLPGTDWTSTTSYSWQNKGQPVLISSQSWEGSQGVYAPALAEQNGTYYMYYSSSTPDTPYRIGIASSASPLGPWNKSQTNPITPASTNCEEPALLTLSSGSTYMFCDTVGKDLHGINVFSEIGSDPLLASHWLQRGIYDIPDKLTWSLGEIGSQSIIELSDGRILMSYNAKPAGARSDARKIGFAFFTFQKQLMN